MHMHFQEPAQDDKQVAVAVREAEGIPADALDDKLHKKAEGRKLVDPTIAAGGV